MLSDQRLEDVLSEITRRRSAGGGGGGGQMVLVASKTSEELTGIVSKLTNRAVKHM